MPPSPPFFPSLSQINKGQIEMISRVHLVKSGDRVGNSEAALLQKLNIKPFSYGLVLQYVYDNGDIFEPGACPSSSPLLSLFLHLPSPPMPPTLSLLFFNPNANLPFLCPSSLVLFSTLVALPLCVSPSHSCVVSLAAAVLDIAPEDVFKKLAGAIATIAAIGLEIGYPTLASVPHTINNAYKSIIAIALGTDYKFPAALEFEVRTTRMLNPCNALCLVWLWAESACVPASLPLISALFLSMQEFLANPGNFVSAAAPAAAAGGAAPAPAAPAKKEESSEESVGAGAGGGLFGEEEDW